MWLKVFTGIAASLAENREARTVLCSMLVALFTPAILFIMIVASIGAAESEFNCSMAQVIIGEADKDISFLPKAGAVFYTDKRLEISRLKSRWEKGLEENPIEPESLERARRVLMKATFLIYLLQDHPSISNEFRDDFVEIFLENGRAMDAFEALENTGISLSDTDRANIFGIWCHVVMGRNIPPMEDPYGIWEGYSQSAPVVIDIRFRNPLSVRWNDVVSSEFGLRVHPISRERKNHNGIDLAVPLGTVIRSCSDGVVIKSVYSESAGNYVVVQSSDGYSFHYMHMQSREVYQGQQISAGDLIGFVGSTGNSTGPHLHLGVKSPEGEWINPRSVVASE